MTDSTLREKFVEGMALFAAGVNVVASVDADAHEHARAESGPGAGDVSDAPRVGLIATAVSSLSADPATLLVCINKTASAHDVMLRSKRFSVNLLASNQRPVAERFARHKGAARFVTEQWTTLVTGAPILKDAVVSFDCELLEAHDGYTHSIMIGAVKAVAVAGVTHTDRPTAPHCLLWYQRQFATSAFFSEPLLADAAN